jgi:dTDP-4-dehydrorhamnose reductase
MAKRCLIIGSSGLVAPALAAKFKAMGWVVNATSRRAGAAIVFDLAKPDYSVLPSADAVVLLAGETSLSRCEGDPVAARTVNLETPAAIAKRYAKEGALVLMLSTNLVFDGEQPFAAPDARRNPRCEYGRLKLALEDVLLDIEGPGAVLRITKIAESLVALLTRWRGELAKGKPISPFIDMVCAPISLARVVEIVAYITEGNHRGIFQHSGEADLNYAEVAAMLCRQTDLAETLVQPVKATGAVTLPRHTTLREMLPQEFHPAIQERAGDVLKPLL